MLSSALRVRGARVTSRCLTTASATVKYIPQEGQDRIREMQAKKRPQVPSITIYKMPEASLTGVATGRATGIVAAFGMYGLSYISLFYGTPAIDSLILTLQSNVVLLFLSKFAISFPIATHLFSGVRHLAWDTRAAGVHVPTVVATGRYIVAAGATVGLGLSLYSISPPSK